jgi:hypothetical protein
MSQIASPLRWDCGRGSTEAQPSADSAASSRLAPPAQLNALTRGELADARRLASGAP